MCCGLPSHHESDTAQHARIREPCRAANRRTSSHIPQTSARSDRSCGTQRILAAADRYTTQQRKSNRARYQRRVRFRTSFPNSLKKIPSAPPLNTSTRFHGILFPKTSDAAAYSCNDRFREGLDRRSNHSASSAIPQSSTKEHNRAITRITTPRKYGCCFLRRTVNTSARTSLATRLNLSGNDITRYDIWEKQFRKIFLSDFILPLR